MTTPPPMDNAVQLVVVSGAGRSGTSTIAGALSKLGFHVPQPEVRGNDTNPRGHFEPRWVVDFHKRLLSAANVVTSDARPEALELIQSVAIDKHREELRVWLAEQMTHGRLVVKDPRAFWFRDLWTGAAADLGVQVHFLTMLRHPTEVAGSRDKYYLQERSEKDRAQLEVSNIAGWVNASLVNEWTSRGHSRIFVRYEDLLSDWRQALGPVATAFAPHLASELERAQHPVDEFIDGSLHRVRTTWEDLNIPLRLQELAEGVWDALSAADADGVSHAAQDLDSLRDAYRSMYDESSAVALDSVNAALRKGRSQGRRSAVEKERETQQDLRRRIQIAEARAAEAEKVAASRTVEARGRAAMRSSRRFALESVRAARGASRRLRRR